MAVNRGEIERDAKASSSGRADSAPDPFVGRSPALGEFLDQLRRAAESESTVLLCGESGTGKGRAAARVHAWSPRSAGPLVATSLVATSSSLIDATLFGHERGAFTDAHRARMGLFRRANGGTVVLDDIEHLPLDTQVKLLRVLQERVVEPLGSEESLPVDVRVVATSSLPLEREVAEGRFRQDLYYRLAVLPLTVPPLRLRLDDIEALAKGLIASVAGRASVAARPLSAAAVEALRAHSWPGNVRELENALERVLVLGSGPEAAGREIAAEEFGFLIESLAGAADELARAALSQGLKVGDVTQAMMERALREHRGNVSAAARSVGLTRRAFDYRMTHGDEDAG
ncbi:MAG: sigma-54-dependent Fis family transcriptional regulator [Planctomycetes bacterium]|nr:sigma-54-dependent Fis family transcriptional regulator [Planctomycetota bacterium]